MKFSIDNPSRLKIILLAEAIGFTVAVILLIVSIIGKRNFLSYEEKRQPDSAYLMVSILRDGRAENGIIWIKGCKPSNNEQDKNERGDVFREYTNTGHIVCQLMPQESLANQSQNPNEVTYQIEAISFFSDSDRKNYQISPTGPRSRASLILRESAVMSINFNAEGYSIETEPMSKQLLETVINRTDQL